MTKIQLTEKQRGYFYRLSLAVLAILAGYSILGPDDLPVWTNFIAAVFGIGPAALATKHTNIH